MIKSINITNSIICVLIIFIFIIIKSIGASTPDPKLGLDASTPNLGLGHTATPTTKLGLHASTPTPKVSLDASAPNHMC
jgi:hypothetical protein